MFRLFYQEPDSWQSFEKNSVSTITDPDMKKYQVAKAIALAGADNTHPLADRYSIQCNLTEREWHIRFRAINAGTNPHDNLIIGFAYTRADNSNNYLRIQFNKDDSYEILERVNKNCSYTQKR
jgi:hypothetical protein